MPKIEERFKGKILIEYYDIGDIINYQLLLGLEEKYRARIKNTLPVFYFAGRFLNGAPGAENRLEVLISAGLKQPFFSQEHLLPQPDLLQRFKTFSPLVILGAGLLDGINPCAFTVIVFFISFLALQGYKPRELALIGISFILAVFLTYIFIGLGLFGFLYRIRGFWGFSKIVNFSIGIFSVILGVLAVCDFLKFKKTRETEGLFLQLPDAIKNKIHRIIGMHYRRDKDGKNKGPEKHLFRLVCSAFITGFLISILEAVCTGQTYLPTIGFILKTSALKLRAFAYLILYNFMFIIPLLAVFILALSGVSSGQFSKFLKRHLLTVKLLMAVLFFGLGIFLLWRA
ncbi:MAG: hypothetical protein WC321_06780 [Candidatus Omnitrophota bacterium]|jgi:cytochrome c biogenesis protein CcdA